ncbi:MAG: hypothetical protein R2751_14635 [Bacteroidales bacterium]
MEIESAQANYVVEFTHNTNFTDIEWEHKVVLNLSGMVPHVGQEMYAALIDAATGEVVDRESETVQESFSVELEGASPGRLYWVDFFTDHNDNGSHDAPPTDHAWRLEIEDANGDDTLNFCSQHQLYRHRLEAPPAGSGFPNGTLRRVNADALRSRCYDGTYLDTLVMNPVEEDST